MANREETWADVLEEVGLPVDSEEVQYIINDFFIVDNIDPAHFRSNYRVLVPELRSAAELLCGIKDNPRPTPSLLDFRYVENRALSYPLWFIAAYPDVVRWFRNTMREYIKRHGRDYEGWGVVSLHLLGIDSEDPNLKESDCIDEDGRYRPPILRNLVQSYKDTAGREFETRTNEAQNFV